MRKSKNSILIKRSIFIFSFNIFLFCVLIGRLYYLQIYQGDKFAFLADSNRTSTRFLAPPRGIIKDRNGVILGENIQNLSAFLQIEQTQDIKALLEKLTSALLLSSNDINRINRDIQNHKRYVPIKIKDNLSWSEISTLMLNNKDYSGVIIDEGLTRYYPFKEYTSHLLGYVGAVSKQDLENKTSELLDIPGFKLGKSGIEKSFNNILQGSEGVVKHEVNAYGKVIREIESNSGIRGDDINLTIDIRLQKFALDLFDGLAGSAVVLDVKSGDILAMVSAPSYDSNLFVDGISIENWNNLLYNDRRPLTNKAISGQYSPGSTFKIVVAIAALEAGIINLNTKSYCTGKMQLGNHLFHCWKHSGHGEQNVIDAIKSSCDIFFYETALKLGIDKIAQMSRHLGLGELYDLNLENQKKGLIPTKEWKKLNFNTSWQQGETVIAGIGQGYVLTTPLQVAVMLARVVNGGYKVTPNFLQSNTKTSYESLNLNDKYLEIVKQGMFEVVNGFGGTALGARAKTPGLKIAGKTGTTQVKRISLQERKDGIKKDEDTEYKFRNHAWFMGFAPYENPRYAVSVIVEHGGSGSRVAAPIASKILEEAVRLDIK